MSSQATARPGISALLLRRPVAPNYSTRARRSNGQKKPGTSPGLGPVITGVIPP